jgi:protoporphyrinogen oxidase
MVVILGGGISGISTGYHLKQKGIESTIFEKNRSWGGLIDNFTLEGGFRFDHFVHLSFTAIEYVKEIFSKSTPYIAHHPESTNYYKGFWLKHPAQNNLAALTTAEKVNIIQDFVNKPVIETPENYYEWLLLQFGTYFTDNFPAVYTEKYWTLNAKELTTEWAGKRFNIPPLDDLLRGAFEEQSTNFYYAKEMRYPAKGGYKSFAKLMANDIKIETGKKAIFIDPKFKKVDFEDGSEAFYETLVSSLPLPELIKIIKDVPQNVKAAAESLLVTSGQLVSVGFNRPDVPKHLWFYIYDEDIYPSRGYSPSIKSPENVPEGKSSIQFETYFSKKKTPNLRGGSLIEHVVKKGECMGLFNAGDVEITDYREVAYANVIFDHDRKKNVSIVHDYLDSLGIKYIGRFGEWDYLWSDQSLMSGKKCAGSIDIQ